MGIKDYVESKVGQIKRYQARREIKRSIQEKERFERLESEAKNARWDLRKKKLEEKYRKDIDRAKNYKRPSKESDSAFGGMFDGGSIGGTGLGLSSPSGKKRKKGSDDSPFGGWGF
jgi:hypothetical protein